MRATWHKAERAARTAVERHGGGWRGLLAVAERSWKVLRALGLAGFVRRLRNAAHAQVSVAPPSDVMFPAPTPIERVQLRVGVMAHVFYPDLLGELTQALTAMPVPYVLMVSVIDDDARAAAQQHLSSLPNLQTLKVRKVANRGRDLAPLIVTFREDILALDVVAHWHTKKSLYTGSERRDWRDYLTAALFGSTQRIAWTLGMFDAEPRLGIVYPESFTGIPLWGHTWLSNLQVCRELGQQLGIAIDASAYIDYPAGSMFWARVTALQPIYALGLSLQDFPEERGQTDGTLQHALERMFVAVVRQQGLLAGILPPDGRLALSTEGSRNWMQAFQMPLATRMTMSAIEAKLVSLDVFDTLVTRPFLTPAGARAYLAHLAAETLGVRGFATLRDRAEALARAAAGRDVDLDAIYAAMARLAEAKDLPLQALQALELDTEARLLQPRQALVAAANALAASGRRLVAVSDMYLGSADLQKVLPAAVGGLPQAWYVSCETGWRKDDGQAWEQLPAREGVAARHWMHIGDNEQADIQRPQMHGYLTPVHVLRPSALLDVVPALRPLRPAAGASSPWQDQLWLGLLSRHLADLADTRPEQFGHHLRLESPTSLGYLVFGPLLADYLLWLSRVALSRGIGQILFLSREGYLLQKAFAQLQAACPPLAALRDRYLLASRRGTGVPTLREANDLEALFGSTYTGSLQDLLQARLGTAATRAIAAQLGAADMRGMVMLPEMRTALLQKLAPAIPELLDVAAVEREGYLRYWRATVDDAPAMVADLGYAGTIQAQLGRLTGTTLGGGYFAVNDGIAQIQASGWAEARYFDGRNADAETSVILQHDLLLETFLTAPDGQFSHFALRDDGEVEPVFADNDLDPMHFATVAAVQRGALDFVADLCAIGGSETWQFAFDRALIQAPLRCLGEGRWQAGDWTRGLAVSDAFTGRGLVAVAI
ncbi:rhamnan synthesis F family protein [Xanthomonas sp. NCPPB 2654]|uniref:rhamnan synthesis F family protein n=1 Tax=unclassified Xanthomonas TaxID=2643310 RepID=UPI0021DF8749|nr:MULTISPECIES: rhamnan synthesis F family protein [unclassified Xanthomonas]MDL5366174.1 rhamnan synthesis F family protein [Xanthomonas sp. NCPPB 2654]UYC21492.1 polysaccharide biosynthesis protein [Xanthomonas sp. CFBP 8443]